jgi:hypothetical protein
MTASMHFARLFTVEEANALLPVLRPLVERILENIRRLKLKSEIVIRQEQLDPEAPNLMDRLQRDGEIARLIGQLKGCVEEIHSHGCMCKGVEQGLVDFPCLLGSEVVFLCWQFGEPTVSHWHRVDDGFAGRRPLLDTGEAGPGGGGPYH